MSSGASLVQESGHLRSLQSGGERIRLTGCNSDNISYFLPRALSSRNWAGQIPWMFSLVQKQWAAERTWREVMRLPPQYGDTEPSGNK